MAKPWQPKSGIFYIRRKVPADLQPILGREYKRSLETRDPAEAKRLWGAALDASERAFATARKQLQGLAVITDADVEQLAARWYREEAKAMEAKGSFGEWLISDDQAIWQGDELIEVSVPRTFRDMFDEGDDESDVHQHLLPFINKTLRDNSLPKPTAGSALERKLLAAFADHYLKLSDLAFERSQGNWKSSPEVAPLAPLDIESVPAATQGPGLRALFNEYAADKILTDGDTRGARKTVASYRAIVEQFIELCGDLPYSHINRETVRGYRAMLARLPTRGEGLRGLNAKEAIAKAEAEGLPLASAATIKNKLTALSAVLTYGVNLGNLPENPVIAGGVRKAATKAASNQNARIRRRKDYSHEEIRTIFTSAIYSDGWDAPRAEFRGAWYWMPLLMYYTGARREELAQLRASDVRLLAGRHALPNISILAAEDEDDEDRSVKNIGSRRIIPLHEDLISRGFIEYARSVPSDGQLFPQLKPSPQGFYGANFGKRWGVYLREVVGLRSTASPSHGFRHTFKTFCREVGIPEDVHDAITGHTGNDKIARGYGGMPPSRMAEELGKYPLAVPAQDDLAPEIQGL
ncbi:MAG: site-specific integrase [Burkholderiales bacterium]|nr:site-specific integrase [Burkholderiales bacterium]